MPSKKNFFKTAFIYTSANYVSQFIGMANSILLRRFLEPAAMGSWTLLQVVLGYCGYASFGTTKAMARDYPLLRGAGKHREADALKNDVISFSLVMSFIPSMLILSYVAWKWNVLAELLRWGFLFIAFFLFFQRYYDVLITLLRSDKKFNVLSAQILANSIANLVLTMTLVKIWGFYGMLAGSFIALIISFAIIFRYQPYGYQYGWHFSRIVKQLRLGIPMVAGTFLLEILRSLDKWAITRYLGLHELGLYSIATMVSAYAMSAPMMFTHVWYPHMQEAYGRNEKVYEIISYLKKPALTLAVLCPVISGFAMFWSPLIIQWLIPKFVGGIAAMKVYLLGIVFILFGQISMNFLTTVDRYTRIIPCLLIAIGSVAGVMYFCLRSTVSLELVSWITIIGFFIFGFLGYAGCLHQLDLDPIDFLKGLYVFPVTFILLILVVGIDHWAVWQISPVLSALSKSLVLSLAALPFLWHLDSKTKIFSQWRYRRKLAEPA